MGLFDFMKKKPATAAPAVATTSAPAPMPKATAADLEPAMDDGDYLRAAAAFMQQPDSGTQGGIACTALLLAYAERFDEALAKLRTTKAPAVEHIVLGEQARFARWRDPAKAGQLSTIAPTKTAPMYAGLAVALLAKDAALAAKVKGDFGALVQPIAGRLTMRDGTVRPFTDLRDYDDAIGQMAELFLGTGVTYAPFELLRRIEIKPPAQFIEQLAFKVVVTTRTGEVIHGFMPLLYPGSTTAAMKTIRTGRMSTFDHDAGACRALGQRDFKIDGGTMMGMERVAAIDFA